MAKLRPRARIVRTIGDQLISGPEAALIELVKNAYDADSPAVRISIAPRGVPGPDGATGRIQVVDLGHGMSRDDVLDKWLEPATTNKLERRNSPGGRRMLGAKGVGRFASARLGQRLILVSTALQPEGGRQTSEVNVDWQAFERSKYLDEVDIEVTSADADESHPTGVTLDIRDLRDAWSRAQLELLVRELRRLVSPRDATESDFKIFLDLSAFTQERNGFDGPSIVSGAFASLGHADERGDSESIDPSEIHPFTMGAVFHYHVEGQFDEEGAFTGVFLNQRGDGQAQTVSIAASSLSEDEGPCGRVKVKLNIYDRDGEALVQLFEKLVLGAVGRLDARRILDENIGVGIYRAGFRIRPYGDAETDWLGLERRRVQDPSKKVGLNQVWGVVDIESEGTSGLVERSSREGLEHNPPFGRLARLVIALMLRVEALRYEFREKSGLSRRTPGDTQDVNTKADLQSTFRAIAKLPLAQRGPVEQALKQDMSALKTAIADLETYQQALASQSALGLVMSQVLHDGRRFLGDIATRSKALVDGAPRLHEVSTFGEHFRATFPKNAQSISESAASLGKLFRALDPISGRRRGRPKTFNVHAVVNRCLELNADAIHDANIHVDLVDIADAPMVIAYEADLMAALLNIIDNAIHWLSTSLALRRVMRISTEWSAAHVRISIANNGPEIGEQFTQRLFNPGFTLKADGSGLGLAIAREAMRSSKGDVAFDADSSDTTFVIELRKATGG